MVIVTRSAIEPASGEGTWGRRLDAVQIRLGGVDAVRGFDAHDIRPADERARTKQLEARTANPLITEEQPPLASPPADRDAYRRTVAVRVELAGVVLPDRVHVVVPRQEA